MKDIYSIGDTISIHKKVEPSDVAAFNGELVHPVCSTFTLAREIEWTTRQFVLNMRDDDEEGIGTMLTIDHKSPAMVGDDLSIRAVIESLIDNEIICSYQVFVGERLIASGKTGQKILKKEAISHIFSKFEQR